MAESEPNNSTKSLEHVSVNRPQKYKFLCMLTSFLLAICLLTPQKPSYAAVNVNVYSGFSYSGSGAPYTGLIGSFSSPDVLFGSSTSYNWHPFGMFEFGSDITGTFDVASNGIYTLGLSSDDGSRLFIDGMLVIDNAGTHGPQLVSGTVELSQGLHPFEVQFFECCGGPSGVDLTLPAGVGYYEPEKFGTTLTLLPSYQFAVAQSTQKAVTIEIENPGTLSRTASLQMINPYNGLITSIQPVSVSLAPGERKDISLMISAGSIAPGVYDNVMLKVTADDGSTIYSNIRITVSSTAGALPDLTVNAKDIDAVINGDGTVTLSASIRNNGESPATNFQVVFYDFATSVEATTLPLVPAKGVATASVTFPITGSGEHLLKVVLDPSNLVQEVDETNNEASRIVQVGLSPGPTEGNILVTGSLPTTVTAGSLFSLSGQAVYAIVVNGSLNTDYVVKGGLVKITITDDAGNKWMYGDSHSDINGRISKLLQAPTTPGIYHITMIVTDQTFLGTRDLVFTVVAEDPPLPLPLYSGSGHWALSGTGYWTWIWDAPVESVPLSDLWVFSENIHFSNNNPGVGEEITLFAEIKYWASTTALDAENVPVNVYVTYPGSPRLLVGRTDIDRISAGSPDFGSRYVYATWKNKSIGIYIVEFEIDPDYAEANSLNNAATRAIIVGQAEGGLGAISGQVTNGINGIGNIMLRSYDAEGGEIGNALSDNLGFYIINNVPPGSVRVQIESPSGFVPDAEAKTVDVTKPAVATVNFALREAVADVTVAMTVDKTEPQIGTNVRFTITATNNGPDNASGVSVKDLLPSGYSYVSSTVENGSYSNVTGKWDIGSLAKGSGATLAITGTVLPSGTYTNTAEISSISHDSDPSNNLVSITTKPKATQCDVNKDGLINIADINLIFAARGTIVLPNDPRDLDGNLLITINDARGCTLRCTKPNCQL